MVHAIERHAVVSHKQSTDTGAPRQPVTAGAHNSTVNLATSPLRRHRLHRVLVPNGTPLDISRIAGNERVAGRVGAPERFAISSPYLALEGLVGRSPGLQPRARSTAA
jgi:hypothetical protein